MIDRGLLYGYVVLKGELAIAGFGTFSITPKEAYIHPVDNSFTPKHLVLSFKLGKDTIDKGLIEFLSEKRKLSREEAATELKSSVREWVKELKEKRYLEFPYLGILRLNNSGVVVFEQSDDFSLDKDFFGLHKFMMQPVPVKEKSPEIVATSTTQIEEKEKRKLWPLLIAAILVVLAGVFWFAGDYITGITSKEKTAQTALADSTGNDEDSLKNIANPQEIVETGANEDSAVSLSQTIVQSNIGDSTKVKTEKSKEAQTVDSQEQQESAAYPGPRYYVIAGCFRSDIKAHAFLKDLQNSGYSEASIEGKTPGGLIRVCYKGYDSKKEAARAAKEISLKENTQAWVQKIER